MMNINSETIIGDVVQENFKAAQIFDKNKIDFCCGGNISLAEACQNADRNVDNLITELEALMIVSDPDSNYINNLSLEDLSDYIMKRHHTYVSEVAPFLQQKLQKLCDVHGENHKELFEIKELFDGAVQNLSKHMENEESILFPTIIKMLKSGDENPDLGNVREEVLSIIKLMEEEHQTEGERFERISELTNNFTCPPDGCNTFQVTYQTLKDFEDDLHRHIHLENNILFKKTIALAREINSN